MKRKPTKFTKRLIALLEQEMACDDSIIAVRNANASSLPKLIAHVKTLPLFGYSSEPGQNEWCKWIVWLLRNTHIKMNFTAGMKRLAKKLPPYHVNTRRRYDAIDKVTHPKRDGQSGYTKFKYIAERIDPSIDKVDYDDAE